MKVFPAEKVSEWKKPKASSEGKSFTVL